MRLTSLLAFVATANAINILAEPSFADGVTPTPIFEDVIDVPSAASTDISSTSTTNAALTTVTFAAPSGTCSSGRRRKGKGRSGRAGRKGQETRAAVVVTYTESVFTTFYQTVTATRAAGGFSGSANATSVASKASSVTDAPVTFTTPSLSPGATGINPVFLPGETPEPILVPVTDLSSASTPTSVSASATGISSSFGNLTASEIPADIATSAVANVTASFTTPSLSPGATGINPSFAPGETPEPILVPITDGVPSGASATTTKGAANSTVTSATTSSSALPVNDVVSPTSLPSGITTGTNPTFAPGVTPTPILVPVGDAPSSSAAGSATSAVASASGTSSARASSTATDIPLGTGATGINPSFAPGQTPTPIFIPVDEPSSTISGTTPIATNKTDCKTAEKVEVHRAERLRRAVRWERKARRAAKRAILEELNAIHLG